MEFYRILALAIGYLLGNITFGYILGKMNHVDLREHGSGNIGTTNTLRTLGVKAGALTLLCDCLKAVLAALVSWLIFNFALHLESDYVDLLMTYAAFGACLGHDFPFTLKFHGGKGVATGLGFVIVCFPQSLPVALGLFIIIVAVTRYVSLGSILAAASVIIQAVIFFVLHMAPYNTAYSIEKLVIVAVMAGLIIFLHHANIHRLIHHKENRFTFHPNVVKEDSSHG